MIEFENVTIKYTNDFACLYNFNIDIKTHTLFIGDEYIGSHSIMRLIAKIDQSYSGNIIIDNVNIKNIKDQDLSIAYVPSNAELFERKSLFFNLFYPLKIRKINKTDAKTTINNTISKYKLENFNKKLKNMTNSEKKIITLVRAILRKPNYILLEDFFENLESELQDLAFKIINDAKEFSTIIACEKENLDMEIYKHFNIVHLEK